MLLGKSVSLKGFVLISAFSLLCKKLKMKDFFLETYYFSLES